MLCSSASSIVCFSHTQRFWKFFSLILTRWFSIIEPSAGELALILTQSAVHVTFCGQD